MSNRHSRDPSSDRDQRYKNGGGLPLNGEHQYYPRFFPSWSWNPYSQPSDEMSYHYTGESTDPYYGSSQDPRRIEYGPQREQYYDNVGYSTSFGRGSYKLKPSSHYSGEDFYEARSRAASRRRCCVVTSVIGLVLLIGAAIAIGVYFGIVDKPESTRADVTTPAPTAVSSVQLELVQDVPFNDALYNPSSSEYQALAQKAEQEVDTAMRNSAHADYYLNNKVTGFQPGSTKILSVINYKSGQVPDGSQMVTINRALVLNVLTPKLTSSNSAFAQSLNVSQTTATVAAQTKGTVDLGSSCINTADCEDKDAVCTGSPRVCTCSPSYYNPNSNAGGVCLQSTPYGQSCTSTKECATTDAVCNTVCGCDTTTHYYDGSSACIAKLAYQTGSGCTNPTDQCLTQNAVCPNGQCTCASDRYFENNDCKTKKPYGGSCSNDGQCATTGAMCTNSQCSCNSATSRYIQASNQCKPLVDIGNSCDEDDDCITPDAVCNSLKLCGCPSSFYINQNQCLQKKANGASCSAGSECLDANSQCLNIVCSCAAGYFLNSNTNLCQIRVGHGGDCTADNQCSTTGAACRSNKCACQDSDYYDGSSQCDPKIVNGGACTSDDQCLLDNAVCDTNQQNTCQCPPNTTPGSTSCEASIPYGAPCTIAAECLTDEAVCNTNCECPDTRYYFGNTDACLLKADIGESCAADNQCKITGAVCPTSDRKCQCAAGKVSDGSTCIDKVDNGQPCTAENQCKINGAVCPTSDQQCQCPIGMFSDGTSCVDKVDNGQPCTAASQCKISGSVCPANDQKCQCPVGKFSDGTNCVDKVDNGQPCTADNQCKIEGSVCPTDDRKCQCPASKFSDGTNCVDKIDIDQQGCTQADHCAYTDAVCQVDTCRCEASTYADTNDKACKQKVANNVACTMDDMCAVTDAACINLKCDCQTGKYEKDAACVDLVDYNGACVNTPDCVTDNAQCIGGRCLCEDTDFFDGDKCTQISITSVRVDLVSNMVFIDALYNPSSTEYQSLSQEVEAELNTAMQNSAHANFYLNSKVTGYMPGSTMMMTVMNYKSGQVPSGSQMVPLTGALVLGVLKPALTNSNTAFSQNLNVALTTATVTTQAIGTVDLGSACTNTADCEDKYTVCTGSPSVCTCNPGYYNPSSNASGVCLQSTPYGQSCSSAKECATADAVCNTVCGCETTTHYYDGSSACLAKLAYQTGSGCTNPTDQCLTQNAVCPNGQCTCASDRYFENDDCKTKIPNGDRCTTTDQCAVPNAECDVFCDCPITTYFQNDECKQKVQYGGQCTEDRMCGTQTASCISSSCQCPSTHFYDQQLNSCTLKKYIGEQCVDVSNCMAGESICTGTCQCPSDRFYGVRDCEPKKDDGEACSGSEECRIPGSLCNGVCQCPTKQYPKNNQCVDKIGLNEYCSNSFACLYDLSECTGGFCRCPSGTYPSDGTTSCVTQKEHGKSCNATNQCGTLGGECKDGRCDCPVSQYYDGIGSCLAQVAYNEACTSSDMCDLSEGICLIAVGQTSGVCGCAQGYFVTDSQDMCLELIGDGQPCTGNGQCSYTDSECISSQCACPTGTIVNTETSSCVNKKGLTEPCGRTEECGTPFALCDLSNVCSCKSTDYFNGQSCTPKKDNGADCSNVTECATRGAICNTTCQCNEEQYLPTGGSQCVAKKNIGEACTATDPCMSTYQCLDGTCACQTGFQYSDSQCQLVTTTTAVPTTPEPEVDVTVDVDTEVVSNITYKPEYADPSSPEYQALAANISSSLQAELNDSSEVVVTGLQPGSVRAIIKIVLIVTVTPETETDVIDLLNIIKKNIGEELSSAVRKLKTSQEVEFFGNSDDTPPPVVVQEDKCVSAKFLLEKAKGNLCQDKVASLTQLAQSQRAEQCREYGKLIHCVASQVELDGNDCSYIKTKSAFQKLVLKALQLGKDLNSLKGCPVPRYTFGRLNKDQPCVDKTVISAALPPSSITCSNVPDVLSSMATSLVDVYGANYDKCSTEHREEIMEAVMDGLLDKELEWASTTELKACEICKKQNLEHVYDNKCGKSEDDIKRYDQFCNGLQMEIVCVTAHTRGWEDCNMDQIKTIVNEDDEFIESYSQKADMTFDGNCDLDDIELIGPAPTSLADDQTYLYYLLKFMSELPKGNINCIHILNAANRITSYLEHEDQTIQPDQIMQSMTYKPPGANEKYLIDILTEMEPNLESCWNDYNDLKTASQCQIDYIMEKDDLIEACRSPFIPSLMRAAADDVDATCGFLYSFLLCTFREFQQEHQDCKLEEVENTARSQIINIPELDEMIAESLDCPELRQASKRAVCANTYMTIATALEICFVADLEYKMNCGWYTGLRKCMVDYMHEECSSVMPKYQSLDVFREALPIVQDALEVPYECIGVHDQFGVCPKIPVSDTCNPSQSRGNCGSHEECGGDGTFCCRAQCSYMCINIETKEGKCPVPEEDPSNCDSIEDQCFYDNACPDGEKCCNNGCHAVCSPIDTTEDICNFTENVVEEHMVPCLINMLWSGRPWEVCRPAMQLAFCLMDFGPMCSLEAILMLIEDNRQQLKATVQSNEDINSRLAPIVEKLGDYSYESCQVTNHFDVDPCTSCSVIETIYNSCKQTNEESLPKFQNPEDEGFSGAMVSFMECAVKQMLLDHHALCDHHVDYMIHRTLELLKEEFTNLPEDVMTKVADSVPVCSYTFMLYHENPCYNDNFLNKEERDDMTTTPSSCSLKEQSGFQEFITCSAFIAVTKGEETCSVGKFLEMISDSPVPLFFEESVNVNDCLGTDFIDRLSGVCSPAIINSALYLCEEALKGPCPTHIEGLPDGNQCTAFEFKTACVYQALQETCPVNDIAAAFDLESDYVVPDLSKVRDNCGPIQGDSCSFKLKMQHEKIRDCIDILHRTTSLENEEDRCMLFELSLHCLQSFTQKNEIQCTVDELVEAAIETIQYEAYTYLQATCQEQNMEYAEQSYAGFNYCPATPLDDLCDDEEKLVKFMMLNCSYAMSCGQFKSCGIAAASMLGYECTLQQAATAIENYGDFLEDNRLGYILESCEVPPYEEDRDVMEALNTCLPASMLERGLRTERRSCSLYKTLFYCLKMKLASTCLTSDDQVERLLAERLLMYPASYDFIYGSRYCDSNINLRLCQKPDDLLALTEGCFENIPEYMKTEDLCSEVKTTVTTCIQDALDKYSIPCSRASQSNVIRKTILLKARKEMMFNVFSCYENLDESDGHCPAIKESEIERCEERMSSPPSECSTSSECSEGHLCCFSRCTMMCVPAKMTPDMKKNMYQKVEILTNSSVRDAVVGQDLNFLIQCRRPLFSQGRPYSVCTVCQSPFHIRSVTNTCTCMDDVFTLHLDLLEEYTWQDEFKDLDDQASLNLRQKYLEKMRVLLDGFDYRLVNIIHNGFTVMFEIRLKTSQGMINPAKIIERRIEQFKCSLSFAHLENTEEDTPEGVEEDKCPADYEPMCYYGDEQCQDDADCKKWEKCCGTSDCQKCYKVKDNCDDASSISQCSFKCIEDLENDIRHWTHHDFCGPFYTLTTCIQKCLGDTCQYEGVKETILENKDEIVRNLMERSHVFRFNIDPISMVLEKYDRETCIEICPTEIRMEEAFKECQEENQIQIDWTELDEATCRAFFSLDDCFERKMTAKYFESCVYKREEFYKNKIEEWLSGEGRNMDIEGFYELKDKCSGQRQVCSVRSLRNIDCKTDYIQRKNMGRYLLGYCSNPEDLDALQFFVTCARLKALQMNQSDCTPNKIIQVMKMDPLHSYMFKSQEDIENCISDQTIEKIEMSLSSKSSVCSSPVAMEFAQKNCSTNGICKEYKNIADKDTVCWAYLMSAECIKNTLKNMTFSCDLQDIMTTDFEENSPLHLNEETWNHCSAIKDSQSYSSCDSKLVSTNQTLPCFEQLFMDTSELSPGVSCNLYYMADNCLKGKVISMGASCTDNQRRAALPALAHASYVAYRAKDCCSVADFHSPLSQVTETCPNPPEDLCDLADPEISKAVMIALSNACERQTKEYRNHLEYIGMNRRIPQDIMTCLTLQSQMKCAHNRTKDLSLGCEEEDLMSIFSETDLLGQDTQRCQTGCYNETKEYKTCFNFNIIDKIQYSTDNDDDRCRYFSYVNLCAYDNLPDNCAIEDKDIRISVTWNETRYYGTLPECSKPSQRICSRPDDIVVFGSLVCMEEINKLQYGDCSTENRDQLKECFSGLLNRYGDCPEGVNREDVIMTAIAKTLQKDNYFMRAYQCMSKSQRPGPCLTYLAIRQQYCEMPDQSTCALDADCEYSSTMKCCAVGCQSFTCEEPATEPLGVVVWLKSTEDRFTDILGNINSDAAIAVIAKYTEIIDRFIAHFNGEDDRVLALENSSYSDELLLKISFATFEYFSWGVFESALWNSTLRFERFEVLPQVQEHDGVCPPYSFRQGRRCEGDADCPSMQKCCGNEYDAQCKAAIPESQVPPSCQDRDSYVKYLEECDVQLVALATMQCRQFLETAKCIVGKMNKDRNTLFKCSLVDIMNVTATLLLNDLESLLVYPNIMSCFEYNLEISLSFMENSCMEAGRALTSTNDLLEDFFTAPSEYIDQNQVEEVRCFDGTYYMKFTVMTDLSEIAILENLRMAMVENNFNGEFDVKPENYEFDICTDHDFIELALKQSSCLSAIDLYDENECRIVEELMSCIENVLTQATEYEIYCYEKTRHVFNSDFAPLIEELEHEIIAEIIRDFDPMECEPETWHCTSFSYYGDALGPEGGCHAELEALDADLVDICQSGFKELIQCVQRVFKEREANCREDTIERNLIDNWLNLQYDIEWIRDFHPSDCKRPFIYAVTLQMIGLTFEAYHEDINNPATRDFINEYIAPILRPLLDGLDVELEILTIREGSLLVDSNIAANDSQWDKLEMRMANSPDVVIQSFEIKTESELICFGPSYRNASKKFCEDPWNKFIDTGECSYLEWFLLCMQYNAVVRNQRCELESLFEIVKRHEERRNITTRRMAKPLHLCSCTWKENYLYGKILMETSSERENMTIRFYRESQPSSPFVGVAFSEPDSSQAEVFVFNTTEANSWPWMYRSTAQDNIINSEKFGWPYRYDEYGDAIAWQLRKEPQFENEERLTGMKNVRIFTADINDNEQLMMTTLKEYSLDLECSKSEKDRLTELETFPRKQDMCTNPKPHRYFLEFNCRVNFTDFSENELCLADLILEGCVLHELKESGVETCTIQTVHNQLQDPAMREDLIDMIESETCDTVTDSLSECSKQLSYKFAEDFDKCYGTSVAVRMISLLGVDVLTVPGVDQEQPLVCSMFEDALSCAAIEGCEVDDIKQTVSDLMTIMQKVRSTELYKYTEELGIAIEMPPIVNFAEACPSKLRAWAPSYQTSYDSFDRTVLKPQTDCPSQATLANRIVSQCALGFYVTRSMHGGDPCRFAPSVLHDCTVDITQEIHYENCKENITELALTALRNNSDHIGNFFGIDLEYCETKNQCEEKIHGECMRFAYYMPQFVDRTNKYEICGTWDFVYPKAMDCLENQPGILDVCLEGDIVKSVIDSYIGMSMNITEDKETYCLGFIDGCESYAAVTALNCSSIYDDCKILGCSTNHPAPDSCENIGIENVMDKIHNARGYPLDCQQDEWEFNMQGTLPNEEFNDALWSRGSPESQALWSKYQDRFNAIFGSRFELRRFFQSSVGWEGVGMGSLEDLEQLRENVTVDPDISIDRIWIPVEDNDKVSEGPSPCDSDFYDQAQYYQCYKEFESFKEEDTCENYEGSLWCVAINAKGTNHMCSLEVIHKNLEQKFKEENWNPELCPCTSGDGECDRLAEIAAMLPQTRKGICSNTYNYDKVLYSKCFPAEYKDSADPDFCKVQTFVGINCVFEHLHRLANCRHSDITDMMLQATGCSQDEIPTQCERDLYRSLQYSSIFSEFDKVKRLSNHTSLDQDFYCRFLLYQTNTYIVENSYRDLKNNDGCNYMTIFDILKMLLKLTKHTHYDVCPADESLLTGTMEGCPSDQDIAFLFTTQCGEDLFENVNSICSTINYCMPNLERRVEDIYKSCRDVERRFARVEESTEFKDYLWNRLGVHLSGCRYEDYCSENLAGYMRDSNCVATLHSLEQISRYKDLSLIMASDEKTTLKCRMLTKMSECLINTTGIRYEFTQWCNVTNMVRVLQNMTMRQPMDLRTTCILDYSAIMRSNGTCPNFYDFKDTIAASCAASVLKSHQQGKCSAFSKCFEDVKWKLYMDSRWENCHTDLFGLFDNYTAEPSFRRYFESVAGLQINSCAAYPDVFETYRLGVNFMNEVFDESFMPDIDDERTQQYIKSNLDPSISELLDEDEAYSVTALRPGSVNVTLDVYAKRGLRERVFERANSNPAIGIWQVDRIEESDLVCFPGSYNKTISNYCIESFLKYNETKDTRHVAMLLRCFKFNAKVRNQACNLTDTFMKLKQNVSRHQDREDHRRMPPLELSPCTRQMSHGLGELVFDTNSMRDTIMARLVLPVYPSDQYLGLGISGSSQNSTAVYLFSKLDGRSYTFDMSPNGELTDREETYDEFNPMYYMDNYQHVYAFQLHKDILTRHLSAQVQLITANKDENEVFTIASQSTPEPLDLSCTTSDIAYIASIEAEFPTKKEDLCTYGKAHRYILEYKCYKYIPMLVEREWCLLDKIMIGCVFTIIQESNLPECTQETVTVQLNDAEVRMGILDIVDPANCGLDSLSVCDMDILMGFSSRSDKCYNRVGGLGALRNLDFDATTIPSSDNNQTSLACSLFADAFECSVWESVCDYDTIDKSLLTELLIITQKYYNNVIHKYFQSIPDVDESMLPDESTYQTVSFNDCPVITPTAQAACPSNNFIIDNLVLPLVLRFELVKLYPSPVPIDICTYAPTALYEVVMETFRESGFETTCPDLIENRIEPAVNEYNEYLTGVLDFDPVLCIEISDCRNDILGKFSHHFAPIYWVNSLANDGKLQHEDLCAAISTVKEVILDNLKKEEEIRQQCLQPEVFENIFMTVANYSNIYFEENYFSTECNDPINACETYGIKSYFKCKAVGYNGCKLRSCLNPQFPLAESLSECQVQTLYEDAVAKQEQLDGYPDQCYAYEHNKNEHLAVKRDKESFLITGTVTGEEFRDDYYNIEAEVTRQLAQRVIMAIQNLTTDAEVEPIRFFEGSTKMEGILLMNPNGVSEAVATLGDSPDFQLDSLKMTKDQAYMYTSMISPCDERYFDVAVNDNCDVEWKNFTTHQNCVNFENFIGCVTTNARSLGHPCHVRVMHRYISKRVTDYGLLAQLCPCEDTSENCDRLDELQNMLPASRADICTNVPVFGSILRSRCLPKGFDMNDPKKCITLSLAVRKCMMPTYIYLADCGKTAVLQLLTNYSQCSAEEFATTCQQNLYDMLHNSPCMSILDNIQELHEMLGKQEGELIYGVSGENSLRCSFLEHQANCFAILSNWDSTEECSKDDLVSMMKLVAGQRVQMPGLYDNCEVNLDSITGHTEGCPTNDYMIEGTTGYCAPTIIRNEVTQCREFYGCFGDVVDGISYVYGGSCSSVESVAIDLIYSEELNTYFDRITTIDLGNCMLEDACELDIISADDGIMKPLYEIEKLGAKGHLEAEHLQSLRCGKLSDQLQRAYHSPWFQRYKTDNCTITSVANLYQRLTKGHIENVLPCPSLNFTAIEARQNDCPTEQQFIRDLVPSCALGVFNAEEDQKCRNASDCIESFYKDQYGVYPYCMDLQTIIESFLASDVVLDEFMKTSTLNARDCPRDDETTEKPGQCPALDPNSVGICPQLCNGDYECDGEQKCCYNNCGYVCKEPVTGPTSDGTTRPTSDGTTRPTSDGTTRPTSARTTRPPRK